MKVPRHGMWGDTKRYAFLASRLPSADQETAEMRSKLVRRLYDAGMYLANPTSGLTAGKIYFTNCANWYKADSPPGTHLFKPQRAPKEFGTFSECRFLCMRNNCGCTPMNCLSVWQVATLSHSPTLVLHCRATSLCRRTRCLASPIDPSIPLPAPPPDAKTQDASEAACMQVCWELFGEVTAPPGTVEPISFVFTPFGDLPSAPIQRLHLHPTQEPPTITPPASTETTQKIERDDETETPAAKRRRLEVAAAKALAALAALPPETGSLPSMPGLPVPATTKRPKASTVFPRAPSLVCPRAPQKNWPARTGNLPMQPPAFPFTGAAVTQPSLVTPGLAVGVPPLATNPAWPVGLPSIFSCGPSSMMNTTSTPASPLYFGGLNLSTLNLMQAPVQSQISLPLLQPPASGMMHTGPCRLEEDFVSPFLMDDDTYYAVRDLLVSLGG
eukprot:TRINITY_DN2224_c0_g1_i1.p1 TRINITY_DN2224_c0_g1~~TRINITY_DN2224_c0_g1_i1.p1  ORF type:complete len:454 (-),score=52.13 TRINITY_DN2224_c0_g1_i1:571-1899(-)